MNEDNPMDPSENVNNKVCGLCNENLSKYSCPRCEVLYCSLNCYQSDKHTECSESFYKECVTEELATYHADDESKLKMIDILKKLQKRDVEELEGIEELEENDEEVDSDDNEQMDLHERIQNLDLNDADAVWKALTVDERNEFEAILSQGDVGSIMPQWEPWWMYRKEKKLVEDVGNNDPEKLTQCPELKEVPKLNLLTSVQPSPAIRFNITNVLASYAFIMRYFNGEIDPIEGTVCLLNICANLDTNTNFEDLETAVESVAQKCLQSELMQTDKSSLKVMKHDILLILQGPSEENRQLYCKAALSHSHNIFFNAKSTENGSKSNKTEKTEFSKKFPEHSRDHLPNLDVSKVKRCLKKLEYYLSYVESCNMDFE